jgi:hypothetical protein
MEANSTRTALIVNHHSRRIHHIMIRRMTFRICRAMRIKRSKTPTLMMPGESCALTATLLRKGMMTG